MQIKNFKRCQNSTAEDNVLYSVMLECKLAQGKSNAFVRDVKAAPEPMAVVFFDWQLNDLEILHKQPLIFCVEHRYSLQFG